MHARPIGHLDACAVKIATWACDGCGLDLAPRAPHEGSDAEALAGRLAEGSKHGGAQLWHDPWPIAAFVVAVGQHVAEAARLRCVPPGVGSWPW